MPNLSWKVLVGLLAVVMGVLVLVGVGDAETLLGVGVVAAGAGHLF